jgi:poly-gamma-glutamate synthesis protein (capsule biosynthesis protein)
MDGGEARLLSMLALLPRHGIQAVGGGRNAAAAASPVVTAQQGVSVGWLAYADWAWAGEQSNAASWRHPGVAVFSLPRARRAVRRLKQQVDVVIVSLHLDVEFSEAPDPRRMSDCRQLVRAGADIVLCHHPHVLQGIERYEGSLICYSLGNCVFPVQGNEYMEENTPHASRSMVARIEIDAHGPYGYEIVPLTITEEHCPVPVAAEHRDAWLAHWRHLMAAIASPEAARRRWATVCRRLASGMVSFLRQELARGRWRPALRTLRALPHREKRRLIVGALQGIALDPGSAVRFLSRRSVTRHA